MARLFAGRVGGIVSADIAVPEHELEQRFYARVLGTGNAPLWREDLMNSRGTPVIGLGEKTDAYAGLPLQWMPHFQVADVAESVRRALALGATELLHGRDDAGESLWAGLLDPDGAGFGLIPVVQEEAPEEVPEEALPDDALPTDAPDGGAPGHIAWVDLTVENAAFTRDFYGAVIGWQVEEVAMGDASEPYADYNMLAGDGGAAAGICHARGANAGLPPVWLLYLPVGDIDESLRRVDAEGGRVLKRIDDDAGRCRFGVIEDPVGATIALARV